MIRRGLLLCLIMLGLTASVAWPATLVGQWTFEQGCGPAVDSSERGNDGTIVGCTYAPQGPGDEGSGEGQPGAIGRFALVFDADADRVVVPTAGWSAASGTITLWVKVSSFPEGDHYFFGHTTEPVFTNRLQLYTNAADGRLDIGIGNNHALDTNVATLPLDTWTHLALSWVQTSASTGSGSYVAYVQGVSVASGSYSGLTAISPVAHLGNNGNAANPVGGPRALIDAVHVYDDALSLQEIQALAGITVGGSTGFEGFGAGATGGKAFLGTPSEIHVTNCFADNPPATPRVGSLRWALGATGNKYVKIDVACPTPVNFGSNFVYVRSNTTIDATNAPSPGFQYIGSIVADGSRCSPRCNNIVVQGLIYRGDGTTASCSGPALIVERGAHTAVFDRNTIYKSSNDSISVTSNEGSPVTYVDSHDITFSNLAVISPLRPGNPSVAGSGCASDAQTEYGAKTAMIIDNKSRRVSVIRGLFINVDRRIPWLAYHNTDAEPTSSTMLDMRMNVLFDIGGESSRDGGGFFRDRARANFINNYISMRTGLSTNAQKRYVITCLTSGTQAEDVSACSGEMAVDAVYVAGTVHAQGQANDTGKRTTSTELSSASINTVDTCTAAESVLVNAGAPQRSAADQAAFNSVTLTGCGTQTPVPTINVFSANPTAIPSGNSSTLSWDASNATSCAIDQGVGTVCSTPTACETGGTTVRSPTITTTYTLTCTNVSGSRTAQVTVTVNPVGPTINVFSANPATIVQGSPSMLSWAATNATSGCSISQGIGQVCATAMACETGGTTSVSPSATITYTMTCSNTAGSPQAQATVTVTPPVSAHRFPWIGG